MALTPVEIRHLKPARGFLGYKRAVVDAAGRDRRELRGRLARSSATSPTRSSNSSSISSRTRSSRDCSARRSSPRRARPQQLREQARKEAEGVVAEAHAEARAISRRASAEKERLETELGDRSLLHSALDSLDEADLDAREPVGESTGEIRRMIS
jgi:glutamate/tyrosine decarboxylase-like PLP-dependent enzyme